MDWCWYENFIQKSSCWQYFWYGHPKEPKNIYTQKKTIVNLTSKFCQAWPMRSQDTSFSMRLSRKLKKTIASLWGSNYRRFGDSEISVAGSCITFMQLLSTQKKKGGKKDKSIWEELVLKSNFSIVFKEDDESEVLLHTQPWIYDPQEFYEDVCSVMNHIIENVYIPIVVGCNLNCFLSKK